MKMDGRIFLKEMDYRCWNTSFPVLMSLRERIVMHWVKLFGTGTSLCTHLQKQPFQLRSKLPTLKALVIIRDEWLEISYQRLPVYFNI
jgi:hypothetical protein